jgi:hypothetical protein
MAGELVTEAMGCGMAAASSTKKARSGRPAPYASPTGRQAQSAEIGMRGLKIHQAAQDVTTR